MSPASFLVASETISTLKRKTHLPSITPNQAKRFRFDPAPIDEDKTILQYHQRVNKALPKDRPKLQIAVPFERTWLDVLTRLERLEETLRERDKAQLARDQAQLARDKAQLALFAGNALIDMARFILKSNPQDNSHSTHRLVQLAQNVSVKQLQELNIPAKYHPLLQKLPQIIEKRNASAHNTGAEFAQLLLSKEFRDTHTFYMWKDVFPLLYGGDVEQIAGSGEDIVGLLLGNGLQA